MLGKTFVALAVAFVLAAPAFATVTEDDFMLKTTRNLVDLCTARPDDPHAREAIQMCQGYLLGAYHYHTAESAPNERMVCLPPDRPARNETVAQFVDWAANHPQYQNELPVETAFRFLTEKWPCKQ
jgi:hypothetical protein